MMYASILSFSEPYGNRGRGGGAGRQDHVGARGRQLVHGEVAGGHADGHRPVVAAGRDVGRGVADDHHRPGRERAPVLGGGLRHRGLDQRRRPPDTAARAATRENTMPVS